MSRTIYTLRGVSKSFSIEEHYVRALDDIHLEIHEGDFVALVGPSGSGKSTLLNLLGCLDRPTSGCIDFTGQDVGGLSDEQRAMLRASRIGFLFQSYNLLAASTTLENIELAGVYGGLNKLERNERAQSLLERITLLSHRDHLPAQLSGGQQQRIALARALMNGAPIILADEPTGALDSKTSKDILSFFQELNESGHTIILVTHDLEIAKAARRVISLSDGRITSDIRLHAPSPSSSTKSRPEERLSRPATTGVDILAEALRMAWRLNTRRLLRAFLTLLGVATGIAAVVAIVAVGDGTKQAIVNTISSLGSNLIVVTPDDSNQPLGSPPLHGFIQPEVERLRALSPAGHVVLEHPIDMQVSTGEMSVTALLTATEPAFPQVHDWLLESGSFFDQTDMTSHAPVIVLGNKTASVLFNSRNPIGQYVSIGATKFEVIGTMKAKGANLAGIDLDTTAFIPFSTSILRLGNPPSGKYVFVKAADSKSVKEAMAFVHSFFLEERGKSEVKVQSIEQIASVEAKAQDIMTYLLGSIAVISLIVGAIGVMNMILVSVTERTREIGLRLAIGAKPFDIGMQFLVETTLLTLAGGVLGIVLGIAACQVLKMVGIPVELSFLSVALALMSAFVTGLFSGWLPAYRAARTEPVAALASL